MNKIYYISLTFVFFLSTSIPAFAITDEDYINYILEQRMIYYKYADDASKTEPAIEALNQKHHITPKDLIDYMSNIDGEKDQELQETIEERHQENVLKYLEERGSKSTS